MLSSCDSLDYKLFLLLQLIIEMKAKRLCSYPVLYINFKGAILMIWVSAAVYMYRSHADIVSVPNDQSNFFLHVCHITNLLSTFWMDC